MASLHDAKLGLKIADSSWTVFCSTFPVCERVGIGKPSSFEAPFSTT